MKTRHIIYAVAVGMTALLTVTSCMDDDWDAPVFDEAPYGNNDIDSTNIVTIAQLKQMYPDYATNYTCTEMTEEAQLKVYVTGNDVSGNLYNSIAVQDDNGDALIIAISESSLFGYLPVGQEILIETKGLNIGGYGSQPQIGMPYTNSSGNTYVSRMNSSVWQEHFKILSTTHEVEPIEFSTSRSLANDCGKLMTIKNVTIKGADGTTVCWASEEDAGSYTSVSKYFNEYSTSYMIYTSTYCDFANAVIPNQKMNLTGIWKRYNNYWELIIRSEDDIEIVEE